ncbi:MAG: hypothetical protein AAB554_05045 [Patescibacteria group bacterium]
MRNQPRNKPSARYNETIIEGWFDVCHLDTWDNGPSLVMRLDPHERSAMVQTFRTALPDIDVTMKRVLKCIEFGRATDQRTRHRQGIEIDIELKREDGGIFILMHLTTLKLDNGNPRHVVPLRDKEGKYVMEGGKQVVEAAALTFERFFPENSLQKLCDTSEDLLASMLLRRIRRTLRARGDRKTFGQLQRSLEFFLETSEENKPERLTANVGEISANKDGQGRKEQGQKKGRIKAEKIKISAEENEVDPTDETARKLTQALTGIDPGEGVEPETAEAAPAPTARPKKERPKAIKLGSVEAAEELSKLAAVMAPNGSNGQ